MACYVEKGKEGLDRRQRGHEEALGIIKNRHDKV